MKKSSFLSGIGILFLTGFFIASFHAAMGQRENREQTPTATVEEVVAEGLAKPKFFGVLTTDLLAFPQLTQ